jgi:hypothetical protein
MLMTTETLVLFILLILMTFLLPPALYAINPEEHWKICVQSKG